MRESVRGGAGVAICGRVCVKIREIPVRATVFAHDKRGERRAGLLWCWSLLLLLHLRLPLSLPFVGHLTTSAREGVEVKRADAIPLSGSFAVAVAAVFWSVWCGLDLVVRRGVRGDTRGGDVELSGV